MAPTLFRFSTGLASRWWPRSPVGNFPLGIAITPDGTQAYVANSNDSTVSMIATATNTVAGLPIPVGSNPQWVALNPDGTKVYVANTVSNTVSVIKTANRAVVATIPVGSGPPTFHAVLCCLCRQSNTFEPRLSRQHRLNKQNS